MKKQLLITLVGTLMLISLIQLGMLTNAAAEQQQKCQLKAANINERNVIPSSISISTALFRTDPTLIPSEIDIQMNMSSVHVGDAIVANGKLIDHNTGKGIPGATITTQISVDGNNWMPSKTITTDSNGIVRYPLTVPDPRSFGYTLPLKVYCKLSYDGSSTYAPTSQIFSVTVLPPTSTTATAPHTTLTPQALSYN